jgi:hypothetical protein
MVGLLEDLQERVAALERAREEKNPEGWLDVRGAAEYVGIGRDAVRHAIRVAGLPVRRTPSNRLLLSKVEIDASARSREKGRAS